MWNWSIIISIYTDCGIFETLGINATEVLWQITSREKSLWPEVMEVGGNGAGLPVNNKQRAMLPNKSRGEFTRNPRKDSEVRRKNWAICLYHERC